MCGIGGCVVRPGEEPDVAALERMGDALVHRGPDDRAVAIRGSVGLVHTRLAIVDPSEAGHQPMADPMGRWLLSYNGEIYNHAQLRRSLPGPWRGHSDTETLVHALDAWGVEAVSRCNGIFGFAALDGERRRLLLVRDHLGIKPLYMARTVDAVWFSSEIGGLLAAGIQPCVRREALQRAVVSGWSVGRQTPIDGIDRVLPGTIIEIDLDTLDVRESRWYEPGSDVDPELARELDRVNHEELTNQLVVKLRESVRRQLMADVPVGVMCSGGLDSSLITALARDATPQVVAYNASMVDDPRDEAAWAELLARSLNIELRTVQMTPERWRAALVPAVRHFEYPINAGGFIPITSIAALARQDGVKVLLTGEGADELFGGYAFHHWPSVRTFLPPAARLRWALASVRSDGARRFVTRLRMRGGRRPLARLVDTGRNDHHAEFRAAMLAGAQRAYAHNPTRRARLEGDLLTDLSVGSLPPLLNRQDKNAMGASVEARVPYLDREVVAFALNLPVEARVGPRPKRILHDGARALLPPAIVRRPKRLSMAVDARRYIEQAADREFLERGYLRDILEVPSPRWKHVVRNPRGADAVRMWTGEIWCRLFLDGQDVPAVESALWTRT